VTTVTLPHPTADEDDRAVPRGAGAPAPTPTPARRPTWAYGAGAVRRAVAELWEPHVPPARLDRIEALAHERDQGLDDVY
jgi:hypothetical protein